MAEPKNELVRILSAYGYPVFLQGSLAEEEPYPQAFFTFWNNNTYDFGMYDNKPIGYVWDFDVNFYATDPELVNTMLAKAKAELKAAGWDISGVVYDVASDVPTHTGRGMNALYIQIPPEAPQPEPEPEPTPTPEPDPEPDPEELENTSSQEG